MKNILRFLPVALLLFGFNANAQVIFADEITVPAGYAPTEAVMPPSPLSTQVLFVGGVDLVQTTETYGNAAGVAIAKEWHDFIGFTPDTDAGSQDLGWVSVNHEMIYHDDRIGDGGGMTTFKVRRKSDGSLEIVDQTLADGRQGRFFNVDFANTVGETGMNCGGISSVVDGRIWTAEEWFRSSNESINNGVFRDPTSTSWFPKAPGSAPNQGVRDTADFTISSDIPGWDGKTIKKYENFNWMVEIDPREAKAIRKQYNWGRQPFEGGAIDFSNQYVYLGPDATPGFLGKFVADTPGDFTKGTVYVYKHDKPGYNWVPLWEDDAAMNIAQYATEKGATMYNRIEWVTIDPNPADQSIYWTETGRDNPGSRWADENAAGAVHDPYHVKRAQDQGVSSPNDPEYHDYYGRIWKYDPVRDTCTVVLEGGPYFENSPEEADYPEKHLSNPDGLTIATIGGKSFLIIMEDLNGTSFGRTPAGVSNRMCEMFMLDLSIENPTVDDLIRLAIMPAGSEVTGAIQTSDGKSILVNAQHPNSTNPFPYNHSLTIAINGFDQLDVNTLTDPSQSSFSQEAADEILVGKGKTNTDEAFSVYPNPTTRTVYLNATTDVAIYDANGQRILVKRNTNQVDVSGLGTGIYFIQNAKGETLKLSIQ